MKILVVSQYYYPEPFSITFIAEQLAKRGHDVTVLTAKPNHSYYRLDNDYKNIDFEIKNNVKIHRVNVIVRNDSKFSIILNYLSFWKNAKKMVKKLDKDFDVIYSMSLSPIISVSPAIKYAKKHKIKHVLHCLDLWPESVVTTGMIKKNSISYKILLKWSQKIYRNIDRILVSSPSFINYFKDVVGIDENKCKLTYQPSNKVINVSEKEAFEYDKRYVNLIYCGNVGRMQEIPLMIETIKKLKDQINVRLYVIGMGAYRNYLIDSIKKFNLQDNIIYLGGKASSEVGKYFKNIDAFYFGLANDGIIGNTIPNKLTFYMSYQKPIIASVSGDGRDVLLKSNGGIIANHNVDDLADKILQFAKLSKRDRKLMAKNNISYFTKHFNNKLIMDQIEDELKKHC